MAKEDANSINLVIVEETALSVKVVINGVTLNVLQDDILKIKKVMREFIHDCKQNQKKYDFKTLRDEKIKDHIGSMSEKKKPLFLALKSLLSRSMSKKAKVAAASKRKSEKKREVMEKIAKEVALPLLPAKQESLFEDDMPTLSRSAYRDELHLNHLGKKRRTTKKRP